MQPLGLLFSGALVQTLRFFGAVSPGARVAEVGSLSARAKMAIQIYVKRVFTTFETNASFLHGNANLQIKLSIICNINYVKVHLLPKKHCFWPKKALLLPKDL